MVRRALRRVLPQLGLVVVAAAAGMASFVAGSSGAAEASLDDEAALVEEGRRLFHSTRAFGQRPSEGPTVRGERLSCRSCHAGPGFTDGQDHVVGPVHSRDRALRHTPHLFALADSAPYGWDGRNATLAEQMAGAITSPLEMNGREPTLRELAALEAFVRTIAPPAARPGIDFDAEAARRGAEVFARAVGTDPSGEFAPTQKVSCATCHTGPARTDAKPHRILLPFGDPFVDPGRTGPDGRIEGFDTPALVGLRLTAPYFHEGLAGDPTGRRGPLNDPRSALLATVQFYDKRFAMGLLPHEQLDLVEFLLSL